MDHYFTDNRHLAENRKELSFRFWCFTFYFQTDNGVFSKDAVDFGSRALIETIAKQGELHEKVLDMGCGYGPIGITLKKRFTKSEMHMVDVNPRAVQLAKENAIRNKVEVSVCVSELYEAVADHDFSEIITNPPIRAGKQVIYQIFEGAYAHLRDGGVLWVVIRKQQGAPSAKEKIASVFGNCEIMAREKGYWILKAVKRV